jgi:hypothetical protein
MLGTYEINIRLWDQHQILISGMNLPFCPHFSSMRQVYPIGHYSSMSHEMLNYGKASDKIFKNVENAKLGIL